MDSHYSPSMVDEDVSHRKQTVLSAQERWIEHQQGERQVWKQLLRSQREWLYPIPLSGGKHENTFLCFADTELTCPFVIKMLPTHNARLPSRDLDGRVDPASMEWNIYQDLQQELDANRIVHFPYVYHTITEQFANISKRFVFATPDVVDRLSRESQLPAPLTSQKWKSYIDNQQCPYALCLLMEYSALTSVKAWFHRLRDSMFERRSLRATLEWSRLGLFRYVSDMIENELRFFSKPYMKWNTETSVNHWKPHRFQLSTEWKDIFNLSSMKPIWQSLFFQVIFTLEYLQRIFPGFRHFDLHSGNILMIPLGRENEFREPIYMQYNVDGITYYVPMVGFLIQLFDFDFAFTQKWQNRKVLDQQPGLAKRHGIGLETPTAYDYHLFFTSFQCQNHVFDTDTRYFLNDMVPHGYRMNQKYTVGKSLKQPNGNRFRMSYAKRMDGEVPSGLSILQHPYLQSLAHRPPVGQIWPIVWTLPQT
jgi:hypothetical protein